MPVNFNMPYTKDKSMNPLLRAYKYKVGVLFIHMERLNNEITNMFHISFVQA